MLNKTKNKFSSSCPCYSQNILDALSSSFLNNFCYSNSAPQTHIQKQRNQKQAEIQAELLVRQSLLYFLCGEQQNATIGGERRISSWFNPIDVSDESH